MTVAAVILAASAESALADAAGLARVRRIADVAWSGGAFPIIVVAESPDGLVAAALAGAPITLAAPAPADGGPVAQIALGIDMALGEVDDTTAALVWPARFCWAGPETVTSLIEAHGTDSASLIRPTWLGEPGWPALLPIAVLGALRVLPASAMPHELLELLLSGGSVSSRGIDLGDPGAVIDGTTARELLPTYEGPAGSSGAHAYEWGEAMAAKADDAGE